jgi:hypothetical protein
MARMIITGMPHPPENEVWCTVCLAFRKGDQKTQERVREGLADDSKPVFVVAMDTKKFVKNVELAVGWGVHRQTGPMPVPLCGTHFPAIDPNGPPPEPAGGQSQLYRGLS